MGSDLIITHEAWPWLCTTLFICQTQPLFHRGPFPTIMSYNSGCSASLLPFVCGHALACFFFFSLEKTMYG